MATKVSTYSYRALGSVDPEESSFSFDEDDERSWRRIELGNPRKCKEGTNYRKSPNVPFSLFRLLFGGFGLFRHDVWTLLLQPPGGGKKALVEISPRGGSFTIRHLQDGFRSQDVALEYMEMTFDEKTDEAAALLKKQIPKQTDKKAKLDPVEKRTFYTWLEGEYGMQILYEVSIGQKLK